MLDKEMIKDPRMWQLVLEPTADSLYVMAFSPLEHHLLISEKLRFVPNRNEPDPQQPGNKSLEETIYDNPLLLSEFRKVSILIPAERFIVVPDILDDSMAADAFHKLYANRSILGGGHELLIDELPSMKARLVYELPSATAGFLRRTFNHPAIFHSLTPTALYFQAKHPNRPWGKMMANLRGERCDIVVLGNDAPLLINSYPVRDPMDAVYHIMAAREKFHLPANQEIILAGTTEERGSIAPVLRRFVRYVMPAIFPSTMFRAGRASLRTPFEMVVLPLIDTPTR